MKFDKKAVLITLCGMGLSAGVVANDYAQSGSGGYQGGAQQQQQQGGGANGYQGGDRGGAQQGQPPGQQGQAASAEVDDESLGKFKDAFSEVNSVRESFAGKLENTEDPEKAQKMQQETQKEMQNA
ncbi:MAG: hypothetical protein ACQESY_07390, partial [Pseudomonadota bacterium]